MSGPMPAKQPEMLIFQSFQAVYRFIAQNKIPCFHKRGYFMKIKYIVQKQMEAFSNHENASIIYTFISFINL